VVSEKRPFVVTEYVRWGDVDMAGVIFHGAYLRFFDLAETEVFRAIGLPIREMAERLDIWLPRKVTHAEYHAPARLDEPLRVLTYFSRVGRTSLTINFDVTSPDGATLYATAYQVLVCVGRRSFAAQPLPPEVARAVEPYVMAPEEGRVG
jgi:YbgC/YbaW family acyl-CoA thioester hydrolase